MMGHGLAYIVGPMQFGVSSSPTHAHRWQRNKKILNDIMIIHVWPLKTQSNPPRLFGYAQTKDY